MKGVRLSIEIPEELQQHLEEEKYAKLRLKMAFLQSILTLILDLEVACKIFGIATSTGYWWIRNWNKLGYAGIRESSGHAGRPSLIHEYEISHLKALLAARTYWSTAEIKELIKSEFGIEYSNAQVVRILHKRLHLHFSKPFPHDYRRPPDADSILKKRLDETSLLLKDKGIDGMSVALGFIDETSPQNRANTVRVWSMEKSPVIIRNTTHFESNTIGFYAIRGQSVQAFLENSTAESIIGFLKQVKEANSEYSAIIIVLDNYSSHKTPKVKAVAEKLGIYLVYLPPYSPDLNPEEYIWKSIKRVLSKGFVKDLDDMRSIISSAWKELSGQLSFARHWIDEFLSRDSFYSELCI